MMTPREMAEALEKRLRSMGLLTGWPNHHEEVMNAIEETIAEDRRELLAETPEATVNAIAGGIAELVCTGIEEGDKAALRYRHEHAKRIVRAVESALRKKAGIG